MELKELVLAILPPALAIVIEAFNPLSERFFTKQADEIVRDEIGAPQPSQTDVAHALATAQTVLRTSMAGAASIAGLFPTLVAFIITCVAIIYYLKDPFLWFIGLVFVGVVLAAWMAFIVSARSPFQLEAGQMVLFGRPILKPTTLFSWLIYVTNGLVIAGFFAVYRGWLS